MLTAGAAASASPTDVRTISPMPAAAAPATHEHVRAGIPPDTPAVAYLREAADKAVRRATQQA